MGKKTAGLATVITATGLLKLAKQSGNAGIKMVGMAEVGAPISLDGVAVHPGCCASACVIFILHQKIQKMAKVPSGTGSPGLTRTKSIEP